MLPWLSFWQVFLKLFFKRMDFYALGFIFIAKSAFPSVFLVHLHHRKYSNFSFSFWFSLNSRPFTQYISTSLLWKHCFTWTTPHCSVHLVFGTLISIQNCAHWQHRIHWGYMWGTFRSASCSSYCAPSARISWCPRCQDVLPAWYTPEPEPWNAMARLGTLPSTRTMWQKKM